MAIFWNVQFAKQQCEDTLSCIFAAKVSLNVIFQKMLLQYFIFFLYKCEVVGPSVFPWKQMFTNIQVYKSVGKTKYRKFLLMQYIFS